MSQCAAILEVLADGGWHSVREIHARAGYSRLNSRVSELRERGHRIEHDTVAAASNVERHRYRLVGGALDETEASSLRLVERLAPTPSPEVAGALDTTPGAQQLGLFGEAA